MTFGQASIITQSPGHTLLTHQSPTAPFAGSASVVTVSLVRPLLPQKVQVHRSPPSYLHPPTKYNDYSCEVPYTDNQAAAVRPNYKVSATVGLSPEMMITTPVLIDTGATMNLVAAKFLPPEWREKVRPYNGRDVESANKTSLTISGLIPLCVRVGDLKVKVWFAVAQDLCTRVLLGTPFIDRFIKGIFPPERKLVPRDSPPVHILAIDEPNMVMAVEDDKRPCPPDAPQPELTTASDDLARTQTQCEKRVRVAKSTTIAPWTEKPILVNCDVSGLVVITPYDKTIRSRLSMVARGVMDVRPNRPFYVLMANASSSTVQIPKNMYVACAQDVPSMVIDPAHMDLPRKSAIAALATSKPRPEAVPQSKGRGDVESPMDNGSTAAPQSSTAGPSSSRRRSVIRTKTVDWETAKAADSKQKDVDWRKKVSLGTPHEALRTRICQLLEPYQSMWSGHLGTIQATEHHIDLQPDAKPVHQQPYRAGPKKRELEKKEIDMMLDKGVIEPANTDWASPIVFVPKPDGSLRFCVDYRRLNVMTIRDSYPIPRMDECIDSLGDAVIFTTLDCNSGYWQIPMTEKDKDKTAFISHYGLYRFTRMPFGLKNAPGTFQRAADVILAQVRWQFALVYLDDVIIYSKSIEEHFDHLDIVLKLMHGAGLTLKLRKCAFFQDTVDYLGHVVSPGKLAVARRGIEAVKKCLPPRDITELRSFLGLCNVYRRFVANFSRIAAPLNQKMKKGMPTKWGDLTDKEMEAFQTLKDQLTSPPVLALPRLGHAYTVETDACETQVGCVLLQDQPGEKYPKPIGYWSRSLAPAEKNYDTTQKECLAVVWAVLILRPYLEGSRFTIRTDHQALKWLMNLSDASGRLQRWRLRLQPFEYDIVHRPGVKHQAADAMSRLNTTGTDQTDLDDEIPTVAAVLKGPMVHQDEPNWDIVPYDPTSVQDTAHAVNPNDDDNDIDDRPISTDEMIAEQKEDPTCVKYAALADNPKSHLTLQSNGLLVRHSPQDGAVQIVVPQSLRSRILYLSHYTMAAAHPQGAKMYDTLRRTHYWPKMHKDVFKTAQNCRPCALSRGTRYKSQRPLKLFAPTGPLDFIAMDLLGPFKKTDHGSIYVLVITDRFSKLTRAIPMKSTTAPQVADAFVEHWVIPYGMPRQLLTDNGPQFIAKFFEAVCLILQVKHVTTTAYHPQANGQAERYNQTLCHRLRVFKETASWDRLVQPLTYAYNNQVHKTTGLTPFSLVLTRPPPHHLLPDDYEVPETEPLSPEDKKLLVLQRTKALVTKAQDRMDQQQQRYKRYHDQRVRSQPTINVGDEVFIDKPPTYGQTPAERLADDHSGKLQDKATAGFIVKEVHDRTVRVIKDDIEDTVSIDRVTKAPRPLDPKTLEPTVKPSEAPNLEPTTENGQPSRPNQEETTTDTQAQDAQPPPPSSDQQTSSSDSETEEYVVDRLVGFKQTPKGPRYRVRWWGFPPSKDTWEKPHHIPANMRARYHLAEKRKPQRTAKPQARRGRRPKRGR